MNPLQRIEELERKVNEMYSEFVKYDWRKKERENSPESPKTNPE